MHYTYFHILITKKFLKIKKRNLRFIYLALYILCCRGYGGLSISTEYIHPKWRHRGLSNSILFPDVKGKPCIGVCLYEKHMQKSGNTGRRRQHIRLRMTTESPVLNIDEKFTRPRVRIFFLIHIMCQFLTLFCIHYLQIILSSNQKAKSSWSGRPRFG